MKKTLNSIKGMCSVILASLMSMLPLQEGLAQQHDNVKKTNPNKEETIKEKQRVQDSLWFEWQKDNFDVADKWDLKRDIIVLYHDTISDTYWTKCMYRYSANKHDRKKISKEKYENPNLLRVDYNRQYPAEHILIVTKKDDKLNYKKAKAILDKQKIKARKEKEEKK